MINTYISNIVRESLSFAPCTINDSEAIFNIEVKDNSIPSILKAIMSNNRGNKNQQNGEKVFIDTLMNLINSKFETVVEGRFIKGNIKIDKESIQKISQAFSILSKDSFYIHARAALMPNMPKISIDNLSDIETIKITQTDSGYSDNVYNEVKSMIAKMYATYQEKDGLTVLGDRLTLEWTTNNESEDNKVVLGIEPRLKPELEEILIDKPLNYVFDNNINIQNSIKQLADLPNQNNKIRPILNELKTLKNKELSYSIRIKKIEHLVAPESDIALMNKIGINTEELKQYINKNINALSEQMNYMYFVMQIQKKLGEHHNFQVAENEIQDVANNIKNGWISVFSLDQNDDDFSSKFVENFAKIDPSVHSYEDIEAKITHKAHGIICAEYLEESLFSTLQLKENELVAKLSNHRKSSKNNIQELYGKLRSSMIYEELLKICNAKNNAILKEFESINSMQEYIDSKRDPYLNFSITEKNKII